jgi:hypothetical protein
VVVVVGSSDWVGIVVVVGRDTETQNKERQQKRHSMWCGA